MQDSGPNGPYPIVHLAACGAAAACRSSSQVQVLVASWYPLGNDAVGCIAADVIGRAGTLTISAPLLSCRLFETFVTLLRGRTAIGGGRPPGPPVLRCRDDRQGIGIHPLGTTTKSEGPGRWVKDPEGLGSGGNMRRANWTGGCGRKARYQSHVYCSLYLFEPIDNGIMTDNGTPTSRALPRSIPLGVLIGRMIAKLAGQSPGTAPQKR